MKSLAILFVVLVCLSAVSADNANPLVSTPVTVAPGTDITFNDVFPSVDTYLRQTYWYYLRNANIIYQANVNTLNSFLFFVIYRNLVGTFLVITTWNKAGQTTQVNTFVRLGDGYQAGSGALYGPVKIDPFIISLQLGEGEYMITINQDGTITVINGPSASGNGGDSTKPQFDIEADMTQKCGWVDAALRQKYWYYLDKANIVQSSHTPTTKQYYCEAVYVNLVGTFLSISHWDLASNTSGINTFVRLGDGFQLGSGANYNPVDFEPIVLNPAVLQAQFGN